MVEAARLVEHAAARVAERLVATVLSGRVDNIAEMLPATIQARQDRLLAFQRCNRAVGRWTTPEFRAGADALAAETAERAMQREALRTAVVRAGRADELARLFELAGVGAYDAAEGAVGFRELPCSDDDLFVSGEDLDRWRRVELHLHDHALATVAGDLVPPRDAAAFRAPLAPQ